MFDHAELECTAEPLELFRLATAFARIRGIERIENGSVLSRCWLAADMGVDMRRLDRRLRLLRWQGLVSLENEQLVVVRNAAKMKEIAVAAVSSGAIDDHSSGI